MQTQKTVENEAGLGRMTLTSWAGLAAVMVGGFLVVVSHVSCEFRGRNDCLKKTAEPLAALLTGSGLLLAHSPAEGAIGAVRKALQNKRERKGGGKPRSGYKGRRDPRDVFLGGERG